MISAVLGVRWQLTRCAGVAVLLTSLLLGSAYAMTPETEATPRKPVVAPEEPPQHTSFNPADFDKCVGFFQYADYRFYQFADFPVVARVYLDGSRLYVQDTGQDPIELVPDRSDERAARFTTRINQKHYVFVMGPDGLARELVIDRQGNIVDEAPRTARADWDAVSAKLQQRVASTKPSPGTEAALRGQVEGWVKNRPDYLPVPYVLAGTRLEPDPPEHFRKTLDELGTFKELRFLKVNRTGWDVFEARFSNGTLEIAVAPLSPSGKFAGESYYLK
jgi:hypothetical protein